MAKANPLPGFSLYNRVFRDVQKWKWIAGVLFVLLAVQTERLQRASQKPALVITKGGATGEASRVLKPEDLENPVADVNDARNFLFHMTQWRVGWSSPTVLRDVQAYLNQCYHTQRVKDLAYFEEEIPGRADPAKKVKRKDQLVAQDVRNAVAFPEFRNIDCQQDNEKVWFCMMDIAVVTQDLHEPYATLTPKYWLVKATLLPVDFTPQTPWGLVMAEFGLIARKEGDV